VLVVDDNATNRLVLQEMLRAWRMRPVICADAAEAVSQLQSFAAAGEPFHLALFDAHMPEVDGFELAERVRSHPGLEGGAILMLSSADGLGQMARARNAGISLTLVKPIKQSELFDAIATILGSSPRQATMPATRKAAKAALRVLVVEDNPVNQRLATILLEGQGHAVVLAENGRVALARFAADRFDVVLMDVQMPEMDGLEATAAIRQLESAAGGHVPIVGVTAHAIKGDRERCIAAGMDGYVSKPIRPETLFEAIDAVLEGRSQPHPTPDPDAGTQVLHDRDLLALVGGDSDVVSELARLFLEDGPRRLEDIEAALAAGDHEAIRTAAHTLKGSAASICATRTADAALRLEQLAQASDLAGARGAFAALSVEVAQLEQALRRLADPPA
jgi:CheY-like chemotaxis protein/HPt (histidine-containing phosphotransfer) domain-containing protein